MDTSQHDRMPGRRRFLQGLAGSAATAAMVAMLPRTAHAQKREVAWLYNPAGVRPDGVFVDEVLHDVMPVQKTTRLRLAGQFPHLKVERLASSDLFTDVNRLYYLRGWTDGLPIVPPTEERVLHMLRGTDLAQDEIVGLIEPTGGQATAAKIAANAVMAGCRPEHMPVLIAAVRIIADPAFSLLGVATTTGPDTPLILVNGPIARQIELNGGGNALGRGWQANAAIGRALQLIINNIGGSWPQISDMSCLGLPGEFANCLAENEATNPWQPLHVELDYPTDANVVSVVPVEGTHAVLGIGWGQEAFLELIADHLAGLDRAYRPVVLLFIAQDTAAQLARTGWTKDKIRQYIADHARMPFAKYKARFIDTKKVNGVPDRILQTGDPAALVPMPLIDNLVILVAGGPGEKSMLMPVWSAYKRLLSQEVVLPRTWDTLLSEAQAEVEAAA